MKNKILNLAYHYVRGPYEEQMPWLTCTTDEFRKQMEYIRDNGFTVISLPDLVRGISEGKSFPEKVITLSFDDGLKDGYRNAFSVLKEFGFPATFFIITETLCGKLPAVIALQLLIKKLGAERLEKKILPEFLKDTPYHCLLDPKRFDLEDFYSNEAPEVRRIKTVMNVFMPHYFKREKISEICDSHFGADFEENACTELFMNEDEIREMAVFGMDFATHSVTHPNLNSLSREEIIREVKTTETIAEIGTEIFGYPYGGSFSQKVFDVIGDFYEGAFNYLPCEKMPIGPWNIFDIPRIDQKHFFLNV